VSFSRAPHDSNALSDESAKEAALPRTIGVPCVLCVPVISIIHLSHISTIENSFQ